MSTSTKRPVTSPEEWTTRLQHVDVTKEDLNALIANYLFTEGYSSAAAHFSREAGLSPAIDLDSIDARMQIRRAVQRGHVEQATEMVNDLDPEILDTNPTLHFHLLQQQLIELIRQGDIPGALSFAQQELAPRGEEHPQFLKELEKTMALLAFELPTLSSPPPSSAQTTDMPKSIASLLDPSHRLDTAQELNAAILTSQSHGKEPKLPALMRLLAWAEGLLDEKGAEWPRWDFHKLLEKEAASSAPSAAGVATLNGTQTEPGVSSGDGDAMML